MYNGPNGLSVSNRKETENMKKIAKLLALVLVLSLIFSLTACSKSGKGIVGTWKYSMNLKKAMEVAQESGESTGLEELGESFMKALEDLDMVMVLELKEDNTYKFYIDEASAKAAAEGMVSKIADILPALMASMFGISEDDLMKQLDAAGMTMDDLMEQVMGEIDTEEMVKSIADKTSEGTYRYADGKLYLTEKDAVETPADYAVVELSGDELRITEVAEGAGFDEYKALLPLVFKR